MSKEDQLAECIYEFIRDAKKKGAYVPIKDVLQFGIKAANIIQDKATKK